MWPRCAGRSTPSSRSDGGEEPGAGRHHPDRLGPRRRPDRPAGEGRLPPRPAGERARPQRCQGRRRRRAAGLGRAGAGLQHHPVHRRRQPGAGTGRHRRRHRRLAADAAGDDGAVGADRHRRRGLSGGVRSQKPLDRPDRGEHQQPRRGAVDHLRPAGSGRVPGLLRHAALRPAGRRAGDGADDAAGHHHRLPRRAEGGAAVDPAGGAGHRRLAPADGAAPCAAAGDARHPDRHHHRHGPRAGRDGAAADDRHGRLHRRRAPWADRQRHGAPGPDLHVGRQPREGLHRAHLGGDPDPARRPDPAERRGRDPAQDFRETVVSVMSIQSPLKLRPRADDRPGQRSGAALPNKMTARGVTVFYGAKQALKGIDLDIQENRVLALIGPSGCGKSTFLRCLNRMNDTVEGCRVEGRIALDGEDVYGKAVDAVQLRARVGMVFQKPNPFPKSIYDNVAYGPRIHGLASGRDELDEVVQTSLKRAGLWGEVKDRLREPGTSLSGGQQQRLCIARAIAVSPEVILMDEPCSALDPIATAHIEELIDELRANYTIVIVTHNMQQAARVSQRTAFFHLGEMVECDDTEDIFTNPRDERTQGYITGRYG
ncbi:hypothetical protein Lal_00005302 [Lupinus albus]|nr:hypothetical protein Lal_00005302 [Lupinus albus]